MSWPRDTMDDEWERAGYGAQRSEESVEDFLAGLNMKGCFVNRNSRENLIEWKAVVSEYGRADVSRAASNLFKAKPKEMIWPRLIAPEIERMRSEAKRAETSLSDEDFLAQFD